MGYEIFLPKNRQDREDVLNNLINVGEQNRHPYEAAWWIAHYYIKGCRDFDLIDYSSGEVKVSYSNTNYLEFKYEDIVSKYQAQQGRLMQIDLAPSVDRKSMGLEDIKKASIAQVALDYAFGPKKEAELKERIIPILLKAGTVGLATYAAGESLGIEIVPPWELIPLPPNHLFLDEISGHARIRIVPVDWLKTLAGVPSPSSKVWSELETTNVPRGIIPSSADGGSTVASLSALPTRTNAQFPDGFKPSGTLKRKDGEDTEVKVTKVVQMWFRNSEGFLSNYILMAGKKILLDKEYQELKLEMPIAVIRDYNIGEYWGRGYVDLLIPMNNEMEYTLGRTFQNLQDMDAYGIMLMPTTLGTNIEAVRGSDGLKKMVYEPDFVDPNAKITNIEPFNTGLMPIRALETAAALSDKIAGLPEMLSGGAPGRVDSSSGLGLLYETSNIPLTPTANSIASAVSQCYRSMLDLMKMVWPDNKIVDMSILDDALVGINMDSTTGQVTISKDSIPTAEEVTIGVKTTLPKSKVQDKEELRGLLDAGIIDPFTYRVEARKRGLMMPIGNEAEWQNYRRAKMNNILLFGDGKTPGQIITSEYDMSEVHLRVLSEFMARPEYYLASPEVRNKFAEAYNFYFSGTGQLPPDVPYLEDLALQQEEQMKQQQQMQQSMQGGGMPPGM